MATVEAGQAPAPVKTTSGTNQSGPRKRRRRAAASGATEDCFTCRKGSLPCDRKRPYCSQCVDAGHECSGYRTTLTWGVGVASRGKLRGMTCPVAGKTIPQSSPIDIKSGSRPHKRKGSSASNSCAEHSSLARSTPGQSSFSFSADPVPSQSQEPQHVKTEPAQQVMPPPSLRLDIPPPLPITWQHGPYHHTQFMPPHNPQSSYTSPTAYRSNSTPQHGYMLSPTLDHGYPQSAQSAGTFSDAGFMSPNTFPMTPMSSYPFADPMNSYPYSSAESMAQFPQSLNSNLAGSDAMSSRLAGSPPLLAGSPQSVSHPTELSAQDAIAAVECIMPASEGFASALINSSTELPTIEEEFPQFEMTLDDMLGPQALMSEKDDERLQSITEVPQATMTRGIFNNPFFHLSSRMQTLLDFYDKHICSVLVAFDDEKNPYRHHILGLAAHNEGLQNAIAALATNNIRMRSQKHLRSPGFVEEITEGGYMALSESRLAITAASDEEQRYKALSINQLNMQLANTSAEYSDAVLATLVILCLFHVCDSGFSKFKTQLAGVQKLLSLRGGPQQSGFAAWIQMFFTWFDVMTSTVNDREVEIEHPSLGLGDFTTDLGALEQFSGCDGRLFKLISRLGRLNLLAQQRPVRAKDGSHMQYPTTWHKPASRNQARPLDPQDFYRLDGNGWSTPVDDYGNDDIFGSPPAPSSIYPDGRTEFWVEWHDVRSRLQSWSMDYSSIPGPQQCNNITSSSSSLGPEQRDLVHINESFRSSALLYTERLANPHMASSSPNLQHFVAQGLFHITALGVTSCVNKFLLWPLFIIGTESVSYAHRATIRGRCVGIQRESGFFNNLSVLEVLERVWDDADQRKSSNNGGAVVVDDNDDVDDSQAFRWRRAMSRSSADGEYLVV